MFWDGASLFDRTQGNTPLICQGVAAGFGARNPTFGQPLAPGNDGMRFQGRNYAMT